MTVALFAGDIGLDTTVVVDHVPEPDEKVLTSEFVEDVGGVAPNSAAACRLAGHPATLLCSVGTDPAAEVCVTRLGTHGVAVRHEALDGLTTRALITLDRRGEKRLVLATGVSMYPTPAACRAVDLAEVSWVHTVLYDVVAGATLIGRCRDAGIPWSIDLEPATLGSGPDTVRSCVAGADVVFVNARAAAILGPEPARRLFRAGARAVVLTDGPAGARWTVPGEAEVVVPVPPGSPPVVDTTGAGDCLAGSFVARRLAGAPPLTALRYAVAAASLSCGRVGGLASYTDQAGVHLAFPALSVHEGAATP